jgi:hypothetical protein
VTAHKVAHVRKPNSLFLQAAAPGHLLYRSISTFNCIDILHCDCNGRLLPDLGVIHPVTPVSLSDPECPSRRWRPNPVPQTGTTALPHLGFALHSTLSEELYPYSLLVMIRLGLTRREATGAPTTVLSIQSIFRFPGRPMNAVQVVCAVLNNYYAMFRLRQQ